MHHLSGPDPEDETEGKETGRGGGQIVVSPHHPARPIEEGLHTTMLATAHKLGATVPRDVHDWLKTPAQALVGAAVAPGLRGGLPACAPVVDLCMSQGD
eukprot:CAMPEP_0194550770 /NCGR_PEP_ID=MMETSP0253-20130528/95880_1 /TAXON_ID=2966 /ORGANISM="Noctiluca scintillans" /LENGTH=98 /DNA_ID=CAMNT_0039398215 /DNA_START=40 /DNA_END=336 /DNA_ORIENTATION=-